MATDAELRALSAHVVDAIGAMRVDDLDAVADALNASPHLTPCLVGLTLASMIGEDLPKGSGVIVTHVQHDDDDPPEDVEVLEIVAALLAAVANGDISGAHDLLHGLALAEAHEVVSCLLTMAADQMETS